MSYEPNELLGNIYDQASFDDLDGNLDSYPSYQELKKAPSQQYGKQELIGKGALKEVFKCYDTRTKRHVALAKPLSELHHEYYEHFIHEAWLTSSLAHPNIIKLYDLNIDQDGVPFFTMDLKGNENLRDLALSTNVLSERLEAFMKVCDALSYAHSKGIIHLDLKPENIQCDQFGEVLVCDWGLGKLIDPHLNQEDAKISQHLNYSGYDTLYGEIKGTPGYMAPEQIQQGQPKDQRTDTFALGCLLYFLLTLEPPFQGNRDAILAQTLDGYLPPLTQKKGIPKRLAPVIAKALAVAPSDRYQDAKEVKDEIQLFLSGMSTKAENPSLLLRTQRFVSRHPIKFAILLGAICCINLVLYLSSQQIKERELETQIQAASANSLRDDIEQLMHEYDTFSTAVKESSETLASDIIQKAHDSIRTHSDPQERVEVMDKAEILLQKATEISNGNKSGYAQQFYIKFIALNFSEALNINAKTEFPLEFYNTQRYLSIAKQFPHYNYNKQKRPPLNKLVHFIRLLSSLAEQAGNTPDPRNSKDKIANKYENLAEIVVVYDWMYRKDKSHYTHVFVELLKILNRETEGFSAQYHEATDTLTIHSPHKLRSGLHPNTLSILTRLDVKRLNISCEHSFNLNQLNNAQIKILDLSRSNGSAYLFSETHINGLEKVIIKKSVISKSRLENNLNEGESFSIITID